MGYIDFHYHNKKTKHDSSNGRNISNEKTIEILKEDRGTKHEVSILSIVNHLEVDTIKNEELYNKIKQERIEDLLLLIGAEINIYNSPEKNNGDYWHLVLLTSYDSMQKLKNVVDKINFEYEEKVTADELSKIIKEASFSNDDLLIIPHFFKGDKKRNAPWYISSNKIELQIDFQKFDDFQKLFLDYLVINEVSSMQKLTRTYLNEIKAIVGSDSQSIEEWKLNKANLINTLINFNSLKNFILFMKKDYITIGEILSKRNAVTSDQLELISKDKSGKPKRLNESIPFEYRKGLNLIFGSRGSGKSLILNSLKEKFNKNDFEEYDGSEMASDKKFEDFKSNLNLKKQNELFSNCEFENVFGDELEKYKFTNIYKNHRQHIEFESGASIVKLASFANKKSVNKIDAINAVDYEVKEFIDKTKSFSDYIKNEIYPHLSPDKKERVNESIKIFKDAILDSLKNKYITSNLKENVVQNMKYAIKISLEGTGTDPLADANFSEIYNRNIDKYIEMQKLKKFINNKIIDAFSKLKINLFNEKYSFGTYNIELELLYAIPDIDWKNLTFEDIKNKNAHNVFMEKEQFNNAKEINEFNEIVQSKNFSEFIKAFEKAKDSLPSLNRIINENKYNFVFPRRLIEKIDGMEKDLSKGRKVEILVDLTLKTGKPILILDEIDFALDSSYINKHLVSKMNDLEKNKTIFIATHSANLAVNTLPMNWIYREENADGRYSTYIGELFSNKLIDVENRESSKDWDEKVVNVLEGGKTALERRGYIYGKN